MTLSFLHPAFLWALPAAGIPLVIHLFFRRRSRTVPFGDLRFVAAAVERLERRLKLRQYLLLLVRTTLILALVLLFARPVMQFGAHYDGEKGRTLSAVLLLDASCSMQYEEGGKTRFERYREAAKKIVALLPRDARLGCVVYSNRVESATPTLGNDREYLASFIGRAQPTFRSTDMSAGFGAARQLLADAPGNATMIVLSDLAAHGFRDRPSSAGRAKVVVFSPAGGDNLALAGARAEFDEAADRWTVAAHGDSSAAAGPWPVALYIDGEKKGGDIVTPSRNFNVRFTADAADGDRVSGSVELAPDRLKQDNAVYFASSRPLPYRVWIVDGDPKFGGADAESFYLRTAFPKATVLTESDIARADFAVPGVVICANLREDHAALERFVGSGGGLLLFPGDHCPDQFGPSYLPAVLGARFDKPQRMTPMEEGHPLAGRLPLAEFDWKKVTVDEGFVLQPKEGARVLGTLASGWPFIVENDYGRGRAILFASTADRDWNNLPARPLYVPFLRALAAFAAGGDPAKEEMPVVVGGAFRKNGVAAAEVRTPDGRNVAVIGSGNELLFQDTDVPGIYRVVSGGREVARFAVNIDPRPGESDLTPLTADALHRYFPGAVVVPPADGWEKKFAAALSGRDMARPLAAVVAFLLLAEILAAHPASRREEERSRTEKRGGGQES